MNFDQISLRGQLRLHQSHPYVLGLPVGSQLVRLFRRPGGDWDVAPPEHRTGRVDPPDGRKDVFGMLYLCEHIETSAFEVRIWRNVHDSNGERIQAIEDSPDPTTQVMPAPLQQVEHRLKHACLFVDLDPLETWREFDMRPSGPIDTNARWQSITLKVFEATQQHQGELFAPVVGVSYTSQHRRSAGRNFALFESFRDQILLRGAPTSFDREKFDASIS